MLSILGIEIIKFSCNWSKKKKKKSYHDKMYKKTFKNYFSIRLISLVVIIIWKGTFAAKSMNLGDNGLYPNFF